MSSVDCIVIGAGHNGLVLAAYLARAGRKVVVLERRAVLGGCSTTEELWPGFKVSTASYVISLFLPSIIQELKLKHYGLEILPRTPSSFTPMRDGRYLLMGPEPGLNARSIAAFSQRDAQQYPRYEAMLEQVAQVVEPLLMESAPELLPVSRSMRKPALGRTLDAARRGLKFRAALARLGERLPEAVELLTGAARPILDRWFETDVLKATLATDAIIGAFASISAPGTAYVLMHHVMGEAGGARGVWGYVRGGMGGLAQALAAACRDLGVEIRTEAAVKQISVDERGVQGVELESGETFTAKKVASTIDAHQTFEVLTAPQHLPESFREAVARIDYSSASAKINLALSEPPRFTCWPEAGVGPHLHGTIHIGENLETIERAYDDAKYGRPSQTPILEITMPTSVDKTLAPDGQHLLGLFVQFAPYQLAAGLHWDQLKESFADRCVEVLAEYAPNVPGAILHRQVLSPLDLERVYGLTGGNIMQGAMHAHQLFSMRPVLGWADHRTPVRGLYLAGAACHPGGGVMGACGLNAARAILADR